MNCVENTVFLSYRRAGGSGWALAISKFLAQRGYDVFVDYTGIGSGDFEQVILGNIAARAHFLVLLTPSALERIDEPGDWLRREIETALEKRRNIVPLMLEGFDFATPSIGKHMIGTLEPLKSYNGISVPLEYFEAAMERLMKKHLNVAVDEVPHPASLLARDAAKEQQAAVEAALPVANDELTAERWFERAVDATDIETKLAFYDRAIRLRPDFAEALNNRGIARRQSGDVDGALADFTAALLLRPDYFQALNNQGVALAEKGDLDGAFAAYARAIRLKPDYPAALVNQANARRERGDVEGALADYSEAIRLNPDSFDAFNNRGATRRIAGDMDGALADLAEAVRLHPDNARGYYNRGVARGQKGDVPGALADYAEAVRLKPDHASAYYNRAAMRALQGDGSGAVADYQKYLDLDGGKRDGDQAEVEEKIRKLQSDKL